MSSKQRYNYKLQLQSKPKLKSKPEGMATTPTESDTESDSEFDSLLKTRTEKQVPPKNSASLRQCEKIDNLKSKTNENKIKSPQSTVPTPSTSKIASTTSAISTTSTAPATSASATTATTATATAIAIATAVMTKNGKRRIIDIPRIKGVKMEGKFFKKHMKFRLGMRKLVPINCHENENESENQNENECKEYELKEYEIERRYEDFEWLYYYLIHKLQSQLELRLNYNHSCDNTQIPKLPKTLSYSKLNENKIVEHCCELQIFISDIIKSDIFYYDPFVQLFFRKSDHNNGFYTTRKQQQQQQQQRAVEGEEERRSK